MESSRAAKPPGAQVLLGLQTAGPEVNSLEMRQGNSDSHFWGQTSPLVSSDFCIPHGRGSVARSFMTWHKGCSGLLSLEENSLA